LPAILAEHRALFAPRQPQAAHGWRRTPGEARVWRLRVDGSRAHEPEEDRVSEKKYRLPNPPEDAVARMIPEPALAVARRLAHEGFRTVFVGGGVRDALLGREAGGAWDLGTAATPEQVTQVFPASVPTGIEHGTVTLPIEGGAVEITTFPTRGAYSDARHPDQVVYT